MRTRKTARAVLLDPADRVLLFEFAVPKEYLATTNHFWATPGGDFQSTPSFSFAMPTAGTFVVPASPGLVADVQGWRNNPASNFGWILKAQAENTIYTARRLDSRQSLTAANRPTLTVTYLLPGQTATWGTGCPSGANTFSFAFTGSMVGGQTANLTHTYGVPNAIGANYFALLSGVVNAFEAAAPPDGDKLPG